MRHGELLTTDPPPHTDEWWLTEQEGWLPPAALSPGAWALLSIRHRQNSRISNRLDVALEHCLQIAAPAMLPRRSAPWVQADIELFDEISRRRHEKRRAMIHRRRAAQGAYTVQEWDARVAQYDGKCAYCKKPRKLTVDHVIPVSKGGSNYISNIVPACRSCNSRKGARLMEARPHEHP